jgi:DNA mismatch endonuclease (patch repair protein)
LQKIVQILVKEKLENSGWKVLIIWECELKKKNRDETLKKLYRDIVDE